MEEIDITSYTVSDQSAYEYKHSLDKLLAMVDKNMTLRIHDGDLIGTNELSVMYDNHNNHGKLMVTVFIFNDFILLEHTLSWVVHSYSTRGFTLRYFIEVLSQWQQAILRYLSHQSAMEILPVYQWMISKVKQLYHLDLEESFDIPEILDTTENKSVDTLTKLLISGNLDESMEFITSLVDTKDSLKDIYTHIIRPSMHEVGRLWETNKITVAHEHLATSTVMRIITYFYSDFVYTDQTKGKIIVTSALEEYHELGARMIADLLEMEGWDVSFLGAKASFEQLLKMLDSIEPDILSISVTMPFNLVQVRDLISTIRENRRFDSTQIIVGGNALKYAGSSLSQIGADNICLTAMETLHITSQWWKEKQHD